MLVVEAIGTVLIYLGLWTLGYRLAVRILSRRLTPRELRGDWWAAFERDFHAYVGAAQSPTDQAHG